MIDTRAMGQELQEQVLAGDQHGEEREGHRTDDPAAATQHARDPRH